MTSPDITETVADFIKLGVATSPPAMVVFIGLPLDTWMYIMSITASFIFILDKGPMILRRFYGKVRNEGSGGSPSSTSSGSSH